MFRDPMMYTYLVKDHQDRLLREAEMDRLARQARGDHKTVSMRLRVRLSAMLFALGRSVRPRKVRSLPVARLSQSLTYANGD